MCIRTWKSRPACLSFLIPCNINAATRSYTAELRGGVTQCSHTGRLHSAPSVCCGACQAWGQRVPPQADVCGTPTCLCVMVKTTSLLTWQWHVYFCGVRAIILVNSVTHAQQPTRASWHCTRIQMPPPRPSLWDRLKPIVRALTCVWVKDHQSARLASRTPRWLVQHTALVQSSFKVWSSLFVTSSYICKTYSEMLGLADSPTVLFRYNIRQLDNEAETY